MRSQIGHASWTMKFVQNPHRHILNYGVKEKSNIFQLFSQFKTINLIFFLRIPADIKDAAFCIGVKNGNSEIWNIILNVYINSKSASDRQSAQLALACTSDIVQLTKYIIILTIS